MSKTFNFNKQFKIGQKGELLFLEDSQGMISKADGFKCDFFFNFGTPYEGQKIELKSDGRTIEETPNFCLEYYGDVEKKLLGGPLKAAADEVEYFVIRFSDNETFWFESKRLADHIEAHKDELKKIYVSNENTDTSGKKWTSLCYLVPRDSVKLLELDIKFPEKK